MTRPRQATLAVLTIAAALVATLVPTYFLVGRAALAHERELARKAARDRLLAWVVAIESEVGLEARARELRTLLGAVPPRGAWRLCDAEGRIVVDSLGDQTTAIPLDALEDALVDSHAPDASSVRLMRVAHRLAARGDAPPEFLVYSRKYSEIDAGAEDFLRTLRFGFGLVSVVAMLLAWWAARRLSAPIERVQFFADQVANGDLEPFLPDVSSRELDTIVTRLASIAGEVRTRIATGVRGRKNLDTVLESMVEGIVAVDEDHRVIMMNEVARQLLGTTAEVVDVKTLVDATRSAGLIEGVIEAIERGEALTREIKPSGQARGRVLEVHIAPLRDEHRDVLGAVAVLHDITTVRRLETMRRDFVANVSHELKTPLTAIMGSAETILDDENMQPEVRQRFVTKIIENSKRLSTLINDVLELSRIQSEVQLKVARSRLDLARVTREAAAQLQEAALNKGLKLSITTDPGDFVIEGDERSLRTIVDNLVNNAISYTPEGGEIDVTLSRTGGEAVLSVRDTGIGIAREHLDRIFERFYRVDSARSRTLGGTGLGLSIVKNSVQAHGGRVDVSSQKGKGTTFMVVLPLVAASEPPKSSGA